MSEQILEQISAFLDGELPNSETELLLKRLARDGELRESFGRYALIGESLRGGSPALKGFAGRVNTAIDGEPAVAPGIAAAQQRRWWRPLAGAAVAASVAVVAVVGLQQRAVAPTLRSGLAVSAQNSAAVPIAVQAQGAALVQAPREAISYTVPAASSAAPGTMPPARLTNYVFAHSRYSSGLDQRGVLADLLIEADEPVPAANNPAAPVAP